MNIRSVLRRGIDHPLRCEDDLFIFQNEQFVIGAIFDGCTSGETSSFASTLFVKLFNKSIKEVLESKKNYMAIFLHEDLFKQFIFNLRNIKLGLTANELLSTIVYFVYDIRRGQIVSSICGDGNIFLDNSRVHIHNEDNTVEYLSTKILKPISDLYDEMQFAMKENPKDFSICSDGIESFKHKSGIAKEEEAIQSLIIDDSFLNVESMLNRKCNILQTKNDIYHTDDLSIIRVIL